MDASKVTLMCAVLYFLAVCAQAAVPLRSRSTCQDADTKTIFSRGDVWYTDGSKGCMQLTCDGDDTISGLTCAEFQVPSWCSIKPGNMKAVYPNCCPNPVCPEENSIEGSSSGPAKGAPSGAPAGPYGGYPYPPAL